MDFAISTSCFGTTPLTPDLLERVRRAGFSAIELPGEQILSPRHVERQRALDEVKRCLELCDVMALRFLVLHLGEPGQAFNPVCLLYTSPSPRDRQKSRMPSSA